MRTLRQLSIKNCPRYFFNSMTNIMKLDTDLLCINQDGGNALYIVFNDVDAYFECIDENKYLVFALTDKNREALENYRELWNEIKEEIRKVKGIKSFEYEKDVMRIKFESDYGLLLGKILNIPVCVIIAKSIFEKNGKYYLQVHLKDCYFECDYADDSYVCCKTPLKAIDCVDYGLFLSKKGA